MTHHIILCMPTLEFNLQIRQWRVQSSFTISSVTSRSLTAYSGLSDAVVAWTGIPTTLVVKTEQSIDHHIESCGNRNNEEVADSGRQRHAEHDDFFLLLDEQPPATDTLHWTNTGTHLEVLPGAPGRKSNAASLVYSWSAKLQVLEYLGIVSFRITIRGPRTQPLPAIVYAVLLALWYLSLHATAAWHFFEMLLQTFMSTTRHESREFVDIVMQHSTIWNYVLGFVLTTVFYVVQVTW